MQSHTIVVHCMIYEGWKRWVMWHIVHSDCVSCYVVGLSVWLLIGVLDRRAQHEHTNRSAFELYSSWSMCHWSGTVRLQFNIQPYCRPSHIDNVSVGYAVCWWLWYYWLLAQRHSYSKSTRTPNVFTRALGTNTSPMPNAGRISVRTSPFDSLPSQTAAAKYLSHLRPIQGQNKMPKETHSLWCRDASIYH